MAGRTASAGLHRGGGHCPRRACAGGRSPDSRLADRHRAPRSRRSDAATPAVDAPQDRRRSGWHLVPFVHLDFAAQDSYSGDCTSEKLIQKSKTSPPKLARRGQEPARRPSFGRATSSDFLPGTTSGQAGVRWTGRWVGPRRELWVDHVVGPFGLILTTWVTSSRSTDCASMR